MADEDTLRFSIEGKTYELDEFEIGELEYLEDELELPLDEIEWNSMKVAVRLVYLVRRREDPDFTLEDARKIKLSAFVQTEEAENGSRPTERGSKKAARGRPTSPSSSGSKSGTSTD